MKLNNLIQTKKIDLSRIKFNLLLLIFYLSFNIINSQTFLTQANVSNGWESFNSAGIPTDFPNTQNNSNWGTPTSSNPDPGRSVNLGGTTLNSNNLIWRVGGSGLQTTFYRFKFTRNQNDCRRVFLQVQADDETRTFVNGTLIQTTNGSNTGSRIEITNLIVCGNNVVTIEARDRFVPFFNFAGRIDFGPEVLTLTSNSIAHTPIVCGQPFIFTAPDFNIVTNETYVWTLPNGNVSTGQILNIGFPSTRNSGTYTVTITSACCSKTLSIFIDFPNCDQCRTDLTTNRLSCNGFTFNANSNFVDIDCFQWQVDGKNVSGTKNQFNGSFQPGKHKICYLYWGKQFSNIQEICCEKVCTEIEIPIPKTKDTTLKICNFGNNNNPTILFNFCSLLDDGMSYSFYTFNRMPLGYSEFRTNCNDELLAPGIYNYSFYDSLGCLILSGTVTINVEMGTTIAECRITKTIPCIPGSSLINLNLIATEITNCEACQSNEFTYGEWVDGNGNIIPGGIVNVIDNTSFFRSKVNKSNCTRCVEIIDILIERDHKDLSRGLMINSGCVNKTIQEMFTDASGNHLCGTGPYLVIDITTGATLIPTPIGSQTYQFCCGRTYFIRDLLNPCCTRTLKTVCNPLLEGPSPLESDMGELIDSEPLNINQLLIQYSIIQQNELNNNIIQDKNKDLNISTLENNEFIKLIPNPTSGEFKISTTLKNIKTLNKVEILKSNGEQIKYYENIDINYLYDFRQLEKGMYIIKINLNNSYYQLKLNHN